ncbi:MAG: 1-phosphofructokinase [Jiangellales bacterium]
MIVTLTPNPSLDRAIEVEELRRGEVHRAVTSRVDPGGKGVNVARVLAKNGISTLAVLPAGGSEGTQLGELLAPSGVPVVTIPTTAATRSNVTLVEPDGTTTKINEPGPELTPAESQAVVDRLVTVAGGSDWVVLCGSLPRGVPNDFYATLTERLHDLGIRVALDTSGPALAAAMPAGPDLIKPNVEELAELTGATLRTWADVAEQAERLRSQDVASVLVSLGADGALLVDDDGIARAYAQPVEVRSTVGAGDATLAGFLAGGAKGSHALRTAVAFGTAAVTLPGSAMPAPTDIRPDLVTVEADPDLSHQLEGGSA